MSQPGGTPSAPTVVPVRSDTPDRTTKPRTRKGKPDSDLFAVSWNWIKGTLLQTLGVGGIATVFTALFWTAGYLVVVRRNVTFGIPNAASAATAYQQAGAGWVLDMLGAVRAGLVAAGSWRILALSAGIAAAFLLLRTGLRRPRSVRQRGAITASLIGLHLVLAGVIVSDARDVLRYFEASSVTTREITALQQLRTSNEYARKFLDGFVGNKPDAVTEDYHFRVRRYLWIGLAGSLATWAIHRNFKPPKHWKRRLIGVQVALALVFIVHTSLLAQFYGLITSITQQQCVMVYFRPELANAFAERGQGGQLRGLVMSDLAFGANEIHLIRFQIPNQLYIFGRSDIIRYDFEDRQLCGKLRLSR